MENIKLYSSTAIKTIVMLVYAYFVYYVLLIKNFPIDKLTPSEDTPFVFTMQLIILFPSLLVAAMALQLQIFVHIDDYLSRFLGLDKAVSQDELQDLVYLTDSFLPRADENGDFVECEEGKEPEQLNAYEQEFRSRQTVEFELAYLHLTKLIKKLTSEESLTVGQYKASRKELDLLMDACKKAYLVKHRVAVERKGKGKKEELLKQLRTKIEPLNK